MKFIAQKVKEGVLDLSLIATATLLQWAAESTDPDDKNVIGCEVMYR